LESHPTEQRTATIVLEDWTRDAYRRAVALRLPSNFLEEARDIVVGTVGREWFEEATARAPRGVGLSRRGHPLVGNFLVAGDPQIVEIIELAVYVKRLVGVRGLEEVVQNLRSQFDSTLLQLAYAYRFKKAGAEVVLEPETAGGRKADIEIMMDGAGFLAECYVPSFGGKAPGYIGPIELLPKRVSAMAAHFKIEARVRLVFKREPHQEEQATLEDAIRECIIEASSQGTAGAEREFVDITVEDIKGSPSDPDGLDAPSDERTPVPSGADFIATQFEMDAGDVNKLRDGLPVRRRPRSRILYNWPDREEQPEEQRVADLCERFEDKLNQAKREGRCRLLIAQVREGKSLTERDTRVAKAVGDRLFRKKNDLAGIVLVSRTWAPDSRYRYATMIMHGRVENRMGPKVGETLNGVDVRGDVLDDWR
jgi:hypothetical protein